MKNDLTQGNVFKTLIRFAVPILAALFVQSLYGAVDLLVVGQFATTADVSGVATGSIVTQTLTTVTMGLSMGLTVYVGQKIGEKDTEEAGRAIGAGIVLFCIMALALSVLMVAFTEALALLLQTPKEAMTETCDYIRVCGIGMIFVVLYNLVGAVFRGIGDSKTPLITVCIACVVNVFGDLALVWGLHMGAEGAAIATVGAQAVSVLASVGLIAKRRDLPFTFKKNFVRFEKRLTGRILRLGSPIALQDFLVGISFVLIQGVVNSIDVVASAGVGVAEKVCAFIMLVPSAYSQAMSAFVAQNMGAGERKRAKDALRYGIMTSITVALFIGSFTFFKGDLLARIFTKDLAVIAEAHNYLRAYAIDTLFVSFMFCFVGYYNGCGRTLFVMTQGLIGGIGVRAPMVFIMNSLFNGHLFAIGLSTPIATLVQIGLCLWYYRRMRNEGSL